MGLLNWLRKRKVENEDEGNLLEELAEKVQLDREAFNAMDEDALVALISKSRGCYTQALSADRSGEFEVAKKLYQKAAKLWPFNIEALDNHAAILVEESKFAEAIPLYEQSIVADPTSNIAFHFLIKCYRETWQNKMAYRVIQHCLATWPDESPFLDFSTLGKPRDPNMLGAQTPPFRPGQVWTYQTRSSEPDSRIWIRLTENEDADDPVIHISVTNVMMKGVDKPVFVSHLPVRFSDLKQSVTELTAEKQTWTGENDCFGEGHCMWYDGFQEGNAGIWSIPIAEILQIIDEGQAEKAR